VLRGHELANSVRVAVYDHQELPAHVYARLSGLSRSALKHRRASELLALS
jgi:hypothetical protein